MSDIENPYEALGGEPFLRELVDRFYELMDTLPEAKGVRDMHAPSLKVSREKLFMFLSGWLGGPQLYVERYGHPRLRARHLPFQIDDRAAAGWMLCMTIALEEKCPDAKWQRFLKARLGELALHMRNVEG